MTRTAADLDAMIRTWAELFDQYKIPLAAYDELYKRAFDYRQNRLHDKGDYLNADATLLVSCWHGLRDELKQRDVDARRFLPVTAESDCPRCFGTGMEVVIGKGARPCSH